MAPTPAPICNGHTAHLAMFTDIGSVLHIGLGWCAGELPATDAVMIATMFAGYQISQHDSGESWARIGGELLEFGLGMLISRLLSR